MIEPFDVSEEVAALSDERKVIAFTRALKRTSYPYELTADGFRVDFDPMDLDDDEEFHDAFSDELRRMVASDLVDRLVSEGLVRISRVDENGDIIYVAV
jgi:hypothetical protein